MVDRVNSYEREYGKVHQDQGIRETRSAATTVPGTCKGMRGGREILYVGAGAAIARGQLVQTPALVSGHYGNAVSITASIGAKTVTVCAATTAISKDQYKEGFLVITCGTGTNYCYMIDGHVSAAAGSGVQLQLKDGLEAALNTTSITMLVSSKYRNCIPTPATGPSGKCLGVALASASANEYIWLGKQGPWQVLVGTTAVATGQELAGGCAAGTVMPLNSSLISREVVGVAMTSGAASGGSYPLVDFKL